MFQLCGIETIISEVIFMLPICSQVSPQFSIVGRISSEVRRIYFFCGAWEMFLEPLYLSFPVSHVTDTLIIPICLILFFKHVQLLTQIHLLASSNPALSSEASTTRMFLVRICLKKELNKL